MTRQPMGFPLIFCFVKATTFSGTTSKLVVHYCFVPRKRSIPCYHLNSRSNFNYPRKEKKMYMDDDRNTSPSIHIVV
jgi:hypothetical protein